MSDWTDTVMVEAAERYDRRSDDSRVSIEGYICEVMLEQCIPISRTNEIAVCNKCFFFRLCGCSVGGTMTYHIECYCPGNKATDTRQFYRTQKEACEVWKRRNQIAKETNV